MQLNLTVREQHKNLRCGYTTGSCAAAAAKAALKMLLTGERIESVSIMTPKGIELTLEINNICQEPNKVSCSVIKDGGDDPDVTTGLDIFAEVSLLPQREIMIEGGAGVGVVTKPGLACNVGEPAINPVPRKMIRAEAEQLLHTYRPQSGARIVIFVPKGEETAKKTFNPRLGILGGISILGTSGIVVPMSKQALLDTIRVNMRQLLTGNKKRLVIAPGNYGQDFALAELGIASENIVLCSNYVGETIDMAVEYGVRELLFIGHAGKLIKVAGGIMDTHSRNADARCEILAAHAAVCGAAMDTILRIMQSNTTDEGLAILKETGCIEPTVARLIDRIQFYCNKRSGDLLKTDVVLFTNRHGLLGKSENVREGLWQEYCTESE